MQIIHTPTTFKRRKTKKQTAKQRQLAAEWDKIIQKYTKNASKVAPSKSNDWMYTDNQSARRETPNIPSLPFTGAPCYKKNSNVYTGTKIKGIGTMHKSNAVPIFSDEDAVAIASMRR